MDQQSRHESDTSSLADEKEIHNKLTQIMNLIGDGQGQDDAEDIVRSEEEFSRKMAEEVNDEYIDDGSDTDLDLYQI